MASNIYLIRQRINRLGQVRPREAPPLPSPSTLHSQPLFLSASAPVPTEATQLPPPRPAASPLPAASGPASCSLPRLPFLAARLLGLVDSPTSPPRRPDCLSLLPSEDVLLPAKPQPAEGAARLHQGPRVGECSPGGRGRESRGRGRSCSGPTGSLGEEEESSGSRGAARLALAPKSPPPPGLGGVDGEGTRGRGLGPRGAGTPRSALSH